ncbi:hypothetical protein CBP34_11995 [Acidovorax carolinensis]|uniref:Uncharacterized protein n=1 Tax=Acidovorax carolinensis TaxID=553814 RepID=A0A240U485_9BURK|nr:hypothetical protein [Acidovorax carolinensis]ART52227.1 hypothetical protein CBP34_11995 [Acidovorax carolinensis]
MNTMIDTNAINAHQHQIEVLGLELEHASGVRALAARQAMHVSGGRDHFDADLLLEACDALVGNDRLFESYNDEANPNPTDFVLGDGCPFMSLDAYLDLRELFGGNWLVLAMTEYAARRGSEELRDDPRGKAEELVARALEEYSKARTVEFERFLEPLEAAQV